jgi:hypothetical protein
MADDKPGNRSEFLKQLDRTEDVAVSIGLVASGIVFTAGLAFRRSLEFASGGRPAPAPDLPIDIKFGRVLSCCV